MNPHNYVFTTVFLPLIGGALAIGAKAFTQGSSPETLRAGRLAETAAAVTGLILPVIFLILLFPATASGKIIEGFAGSRNAAVGVAFRFDGLSWLMNVLIYSAAFPSWLYHQKKSRFRPGFTALLLILTSSLSAAAVTADIFNLFVCLEVMGICSYVLITESGKPRGILASFSYLLFSAAGMIFFLLGVYGLYRATGDLSYTGIGRQLSLLPERGGWPVSVSLIFITAAVSLRAAVMPLHGWLPEAHAMAPHGVSAMLSGVLTKIPLFALTRILSLSPEGMQLGRLLGYAGAVTALCGVILALAQSDAKRLLAYHSISQLGYVLSAWGMAVYYGTDSVKGVRFLTAAILYASFHTLFKSLLFLTVGRTTDTAGERNVYALRGAAALLKSRGERFPVTLLCFLIGALSITAVPPFIGYAGKTVLAGLFKHQWQYPVLLAAGAGTMASFIKLLRIFLPNKNKKDQPHQTEPSLSEPAPAQWAAQILLAVLSLAAAAAAPVLFINAHTLLSAVHKTAGGFNPDIYTIRNLLKFVLTLAAGLLLFLPAVRPGGMKLLHRVQKIPGLGQFPGFALTLGGMALWLF